MAGVAIAEQLDRGVDSAESESGAQELTLLDSERFTRAKAERFIGAIIVGNEAAVMAEASPAMSLHEASRRAAEGDPDALSYAYTCIKTDVIERSIKKGHISKVTQTMDAHGHLGQSGRSGRGVHANSLRFASQNPRMLPRTMAETRNLFRLEDAYRQGLLKDHYVVVPSRPADDMTEAELHAEGFFVDTMSIALQVTTEESDGSITTESAFVAGKRHRHAPRHDAELVRKLASQLGMELGEQTAVEGIDRPWLVPKHLMPHGVIDLVRLADQAMGTFFGEDRPVEDYQAYRETCRARERELEPTAQKIMAQLIRESATFRTPLDATRRLHELSEAALVQRALYDAAIDTTVFGAESAAYLQAARYHLERGEAEQVGLFMDKALRVADSNSCPGGGIKTSSEGRAGSDGSSQSTAEDGDCEFTSKECPLCHKKNVKTVVKKMASGKKQISGECGCTAVA